MITEVIAIDPGFTTGYAVIDVDENENAITLHAHGAEWFGPGNNSQLFGQEAKFFEELIWMRQESGDIFGEFNELVVAMEDFVGSGARNTNAIYVLKLVGLISGLTYVKNIKLEIQAPQWRKPFLEYARGIYHANNHKKPIIHEVDALAHGLTYAYRQKLWKPD